MTGVLTCALPIWEAQTATGEWEERRRDQKLSWMWAMVEDRLLATLREDPSVQRLLAEVEHGVREAEMTPTDAADRLLGAFDGSG